MNILLTCLISVEAKESVTQRLVELDPSFENYFSLPVSFNGENPPDYFAGSGMLGETFADRLVQAVRYDNVLCYNSTLSQCLDLFSLQRIPTEASANSPFQM